MRLEATREGKTFAERMNILTNYIGPFKQMWPFYWLKAAAIRDPQATIWQLRYFSLVGRWSSNKPTSEFCDEGSTVIALSQLIDAERAEKILLSLQASGTVELWPNVTAAVQLEPDITLPTVSYWQDRVPFQVPKVLTEVSEPATWHYLYLSDRKPKGLGTQYDKNILDVEKRISRAVQDDLDERSLNDFTQFTSTRLGLGYGGGREPSCSIDDFCYEFDLPLALRVKRDIPDRTANTLPLTIYCRPPLKLENVRASIGDIWLPSAKAMPLTIETSGEEWSVGEVVIPYNSGKLWLKFECLAKSLSYDIPLPTREDQAAEVMGLIYSMASSDKGKEKWKTHLLREDGENFEIALLNAIARFGIAVSFAGQLQGGGTATPGFDLVVWDHLRNRAVLISAKGSAHNPSQEACQKLLDAVKAVQKILQGWDVAGVLACHATDNMLGLAKQRKDLQIWSREDLEMLYQADKRETIDLLLWPSPHLLHLAHQWG